jgi:carboxyl-terminal processing protease
MRTLTAVESLNFYENVVTQIQREYADVPRWEPLFRHGIQSFSIALTDANFRAKVNLNISESQVNSYLSGVQETVNGWTIRDREDMKNGMLYVAEGAQKQIGLNPVVAVMEFTCGVVGSLDPNTAYLTPNQLNDQYSAIYGNLVGLGVELRSERDYLLITRVIQGSPAEEGGLKAGDRILAVDGISLTGQENAADLLQGEEGTTVKLSIISDGLGQRQRELAITRRHIEVPSVEDVRMINDKLGYIKLTGFQSKTCVELTKALNDLNRQGMKSLVLDLRQNPGGLFPIGVEVANMFIEQGAIVRTRGRDFGPDSPCMATPGNTWQVPLIVLIDEESASASEIVAGAIRDHDRGTIVGKQSYGKGTIQKIIPVQTGSGLKLTTEKFYSPKGWAYSGVGVTPHHIIKEEKRTTLARPWEGRLQFTRPVTSNLNDPFIQEAVRISQAL